MGMVWVMTLATDQQVDKLRADPDAIYDFINAEQAYEDGRALDLDKQWHAVHFLLTGAAGATDGPLSLIIGSFEELGPDNGYGPAWLVPKDFLTTFAAALRACPNDELVGRYDPAAMVREDVYIADMFVEEGDEGRDFLIQDVARLRAVANKAAAEHLNAFALIT